MKVSEVISLADWFEMNIPVLCKRYGQLAATLQHNAQDPQRQPVKEKLEAV